MFGFRTLVKWTHLLETRATLGLGQSWDFRYSYPAHQRQWSAPWGESEYRPSGWGGGVLVAVVSTEYNLSFTLYSFSPGLLLKT